MTSLPREPAETHAATGLSGGSISGGGFDDGADRPHTAAMGLGRYLPAVVRSRPDTTIRIRYRTLAQTLPMDAPRIILDALHASGLHDVRAADGRWQALLEWRTMVYGIIRRDVEETLSLQLCALEPGWELVVECVPVETHSAHAAGVGGVLALAATVWLAAGWTTGVLPGLTTLLAGGLWVDATRVMALGALERRVRSVTADVGSALWPSAPAEILPPPPSFSSR